MNETANTGLIKLLEIFNVVATVKNEEVKMDETQDSSDIPPPTVAIKNESASSMVQYSLIQMQLKTCNMTVFDCSAHVL